MALVKKQGRKHGRTVADSLEGAVMPLRESLKKGYYPASLIDFRMSECFDFFSSEAPAESQKRVLMKGTTS